MTTASPATATTQLSVEGIEVFINDNRSLAGRQAGAGVHFDAGTLLMVHGWPDTHRLWDSTVTALQDHHRCARFTLPGFDVALATRGTSLADMTALLLNIVDAISPDQPVTLLLHDWGCFFGYEFAARHPGRVARIVAVDIGDHNSAALDASLNAKAKLQVLGYQLWLALAWKMGGSLGNRMTRWMAHALRCKTNPALMGWQMNYPYAMQWFGSLGGFRGAAPVEPACPLLYLYGQRKPFMFHSQQWLNSVAARPGCAVQGFATGHWVMVGDPAGFHSAVASWLNEPIDSFLPSQVAA